MRDWGIGFGIIRKAFEAQAFLKTMRLLILPLTPALSPPAGRG
jgi:hypothetical protein